VFSFIENTGLKWYNKYNRKANNTYCRCYEKVTKR
jgi:hypothetical protein